jgi:hypothetical protein
MNSSNYLFFPYVTTPVIKFIEKKMFPFGLPLLVPVFGFHRLKYRNTGIEILTGTASPTHVAAHNLMTDMRGVSIAYPSLTCIQSLSHGSTRTQYSQAAICVSFSASPLESDPTRISKDPPAPNLRVCRFCVPFQRILLQYVEQSGIGNAHSSDVTEENLSCNSCTTSSVLKVCISLKTHGI